MKEIVAWLNSTRNYTDGVNLYQQHGTDAELLKYFLVARTQASQEKLFQSLKEIYYLLKNPSNVTEHKRANNAKGEKSTIKHLPNVAKKFEISLPIEQTSKIRESNSKSNPSLEAACKLEADKVYKEMMNERALLFAQCKMEPSRNENNASAIAIRKPIALRIVNMQPGMNKAFEKLNYVAEHGVLPTEPDQSEDLPTHPIELERMRSNLIENISRHKRNPDQSAERIALIQKHELTLKRVVDVINQL